MKKEKTEKEILDEEAEKKEKALQKLHKITYKKRLNAFGNCFRSKGIVWLGNPGKYNGYGSWSHAGNYLDFGFANSWYDLPVEDVNDKDFTFEKALQNAKTEIVFIGQDLKVDNIKAELDKCLLTVKEFSILKKEILKKKGYKTYLFDDPYTDWPVWLQCDNPHVAQEKYYAKYLKAEDDLRLKEDTSKENQIKQI